MKQKAPVAKIAPDINGWLAKIYQGEELLRTIPMGFDVSLDALLEQLHESGARSYILFNDPPKPIPSPKQRAVRAAFSEKYVSSPGDKRLRLEAEAKVAELEKTIADKDRRLAYANEQVRLGTRANERANEAKDQAVREAEALRQKLACVEEECSGLLKGARQSLDHARKGLLILWVLVVVLFFSTLFFASGYKRETTSLAAPFTPSAPGFIEGVTAP